MFSLRQRGFPPGALKMSTRGHLATLKLPVGEWLVRPVPRLSAALG